MQHFFKLTKWWKDCFTVFCSLRLTKLSVIYETVSTPTHINITILSALLELSKVLSFFFCLLFYVLPLILSSFQHWVIHHTYFGVIHFSFKNSKFHGASHFLSTSQHFLWETAEALEVLITKVSPTIKWLWIYSSQCNIYISITLKYYPLFLWSLSPSIYL